MALPSSGKISLSQIKAEFDGTSALSSYYRGGGHVTDNNASVPTTGKLSLSNFLGAFRAYSGSWDQGTPGSYDINIPPHAWLRVRLWGGGGAYKAGAVGGNGGDTSCSLFGMIAGGGRNQTGGAATGGNQENLPGENGHNKIGDRNGGSSPNGGAGGGWSYQGTARPGGWPGGGGGGYVWAYDGYNGPGGGGGSFCHSLFGPSAEQIVIPVVVGAGGTGLDSRWGNGAAGRALIEWGL